jgi:hydroxymethylbilane synthase
MIPAAGQGALCVEVRGGDEACHRLLAPLDHPATHQATEAERAFLRRLEGGCQVPIGAHAEVREDELFLHGLIASVDGSRLVRDSVRGLAASAASLGTALAGRLLTTGGAEILEEVLLGS